MDLTSYMLGKKSGGGGSSGGRDWSEIGYSAEPKYIQDGFDYAKTIKENWDSTTTSYYNKFNKDLNLIYMPLVDTSNGTNFQSMFNECTLLEIIPSLNTSKGTKFAYFCSNCYSLKQIGQLDTSSSTGFNSMFSNCQSLKNVPEFDLSSATTITAIVSSCYNLINFGGFKDLGKAYLTSQSANYSNYMLVLNQSTKLTHDSLMNVINKVYDIATKGCNAQKLTLGTGNIAKLTAEEIAIATNKGWTVS